MLLQNNDYFFKILLLGHWQAGKSSLQNRFANYIPHPGFPLFFRDEFKITTKTVDKQTVKLQMWEPNGKDRFRPVLANYFRGIQGVFLIYDISDKKSFIDIEFWLKRVEKYGQESIVKMLVGNKCDLQSKRQVSFEEGKEYADKLGIPFMEVSAQDGTSVEDVLGGLIKELIAKTKALENMDATGEEFDRVKRISEKTIERKLMSIVGILCILSTALAFVVKIFADSVETNAEKMSL